MCPSELLSMPSFWRPHLRRVNSSFHVLTRYSTLYGATGKASAITVDRGKPPRNLEHYCCWPGTSLSSSRLARTSQICQRTPTMRCFVRYLPHATTTIPSCTLSPTVGKGRDGKQHNLLVHERCKTSSAGLSDGRGNEIYTSRPQVLGRWPLFRTKRYRRTWKRGNTSGRHNTVDSAWQWKVIAGRLSLKVGRMMA